MTRAEVAAMITDDFLSVDGLQLVTVESCNPDTGAVEATSSGVTALNRTNSETTVATMDGGEVEITKARFHLLASAVGFEPKKRDKITDADGAVWVIDTVNSVAFNTRYVCEVVLKA